MTGIKPQIITEMLETKRVIDAHPIEMLAALFDLKVYRMPKLVAIGNETGKTRSIRFCGPEWQARQYIKRIAYAKAAASYKRKVTS